LKTLDQRERTEEGSFPLNRFIPSLLEAVQRSYQSRKVSQMILPSLDKAPLIAPRHLVRTQSLFVSTRILARPVGEDGE